MDDKMKIIGALSLDDGIANRVFYDILLLFMQSPEGDVIFGQHFRINYIRNNTIIVC